MNWKRIGGIIVFGLGVVLILFALDAMHKISAAKGAIHGVSSLFEKGSNSAVSFLGGAAEHKIGSYDAPVMGLLIAGIVLAVAGAFIYCYFKKKRR